MNNLLYGINDKPPIGKWCIYALQYLFAVLPATILISSICGTSIASGLISAGIGTIIFLIVTGFKVPMLTSNSGATVSAIVGVFALSGGVEHHFTGVVLGGCVMAIIYCIGGILVKKFGISWLFKIMPPIVAGTTILIIGATLAFFIPTYAEINGEYSLTGVAIAFGVMIITCLFAHYGKGVLKTIPFLMGLVIGYVVAIIFTLCNIVNLVDLSQFTYTSVLSVPDLAFLHLDFVNYDWSTLPEIILMFGLVSLAAMGEHIADVSSVSQVAGINFIEKPGLHRTLIGDGLSSLAGSLTGAQMTTTYSEYTGTMAISRVGSVWVTLTTALLLIFCGFLTPFNQFLSALPNCVFAGVAICAYGMIALTGMRTLVNANIDWKDSKNTLIFGCMISCGIGGIAINAGHFSISGIVVGMICGIILNLILREKRNA